MPALLGDPMEVALVEMALHFMSGVPSYPRLDEIPFDAERMRLSTVHQAPEGPALYCKGAPESVLPLCQHILVEGKVRPLGAEARTKHHSGARCHGEPGPASSGPCLQDAGGTL